ncbi:MAG: hypothetical protein K5744_06590 [Eubacterium sp.]|nr:hypothetical protein [Eubacterium sp.]
MELNGKKGKLCLRAAFALYVIFWLLLVVFGLFSNPASRYVLSLFDGNANYYLGTLLALLFGILIAGTFLCRQAKRYTNGGIGSKVTAIVYLVTFILAIAAIFLFILFVLLMVASGSLM